MGISKDLLSVIIPMFNAGSVIEATLDSIAKQRDINIEIIVVDDVSTDNSVETVSRWQERNPQVSSRILMQPEKARTLKARLAGVKAARGRDIMFVDADDQLVGACRLARICGIKREGNFDIVHFRSQFRKIQRGEALWNAPISSKALYGQEIFSAYAGMDFPPVLIWGKIYSASLFRKILPLAEKIKIYRLEDVFLFSLLMLYAGSYCPVEEYAYLYEVSDNWPPEKFAGRVHDLFCIQRFFKSLFEDRDVDSRDRQNFMAFLKRRMSFNMSGLCRTIIDELDRSEPSSKLLSRLEPYFKDMPILAGLCALSADMRAKNELLVKRIDDGS